MASQSQLWSDLPQELLESISRNLTSFSDHLRFRSVCRSWRSAAKTTQSRPHFPLLIIRDDASTTTRSFLNPSNGRILTIDLPELQGQAICGTSTGWLVVVNSDLELSLLNPITRSTIPLPPTSGAFARSLDIERFMNQGNNYSLREMANQVNYYAFMEHYPDDCIVVCTRAYGDHTGFVYCTPGDVTWTGSSSDLRGFASFAYHKGKLYCKDYFGDFAVCDVRNDPMRKFTIVSSLKIRCNLRCHVMSRDEDLMVVVVTDSVSSCYEIFKLNTNGDHTYGDWRWERLDIGNGSLDLWPHHIDMHTVPGPRNGQEFSCWFIAKFS